MGNLGMYQVMTTFAKKVGGPVQFLGMVAVGGYVVLRTAEAGGKAITRAVIKCFSPKEENDMIYTVHTAGTSNNDLHFVVGDAFHVLEIDRDAVLIERIGDANNPYFVSSDLLCSISDFGHQYKGK